MVAEGRKCSGKVWRVWKASASKGSGVLCEALRSPLGKGLGNVQLGTLSNRPGCISARWRGSVKAWASSPNGYCSLIRGRKSCAIPVSTEHCSVGAGGQSTLFLEVCYVSSEDLVARGVDCAGGRRCRPPRP